jgi:hypothetical protein
LGNNLKFISELLRDAHNCSFSLSLKDNYGKTKSQHHGRAWYVSPHIFSGYEDNVARNLKQRIESMDMQDLIFDVMVPIEKKIKIKGGKENVVVEEKIYPGYVLS